MQAIDKIAASGTKARIKAIRAGFAASTIDVISEDLGMLRRDVYRIIGVPERTATRLVRENRNLDQAASERLLRLTTVVEQATEAFGSRERALQWITKHNCVLSSKPLELLDTALGFDEVRRMLLAIEHGLPV